MLLRNYIPIVGALCLGIYIGRTQMKSKIRKANGGDYEGKCYWKYI